MVYSVPAVQSDPSEFSSVGRPATKRVQRRAGGQMPASQQNRAWARASAALCTAQRADRPAIGQHLLCPVYAALKAAPHRASDAERWSRPGNRSAPRRRGAQGASAAGARLRLGPSQARRRPFARCQKPLPWPKRLCCMPSTSAQVHPNVAPRSTLHAQAQALCFRRAPCVHLCAHAISPLHSIPPPPTTTRPPRTLPSPPEPRRLPPRRPSPVHNGTRRPRTHVELAAWLTEEGGLGLIDTPPTPQAIEPALPQ